MTGDGRASDVNPTKMLDTYHFTPWRKQENAGQKHSLLSWEESEPGIGLYHIDGSMYIGVDSAVQHLGQNWIFKYCSYSQL